MSARPPLPRGFPLEPSHPERVCWGCDRLCAAHDMACGTEIVRGMHPSELFGPAWWKTEEPSPTTASSPAAPGSEAARD